MTQPDERTILVLGVSLALEAVAAEVAEALRAAGLRSILMKGPALVRWLYGVETARPSTDVDLLVDAEKVDTAVAVLWELGFRRVATGIGAADRPRHATMWIRSAGEPPVDLHTTIVGVGVTPAEAWSVLKERTEIARVGGARVEVPAPDARLLQIALHAAQHGKHEPQPVQDLNRARAIASQAEWDGAASLARRLGAEAAFAAGLDLLQSGRELRAALRLPSARTVESSLRATSPPALALGLEWFLRAPGLRARLRFALGKTVPPAAFMRTWSPLARRGRLGLAAAYVWRPGWLLLRAGPAIRAWLRARRESRA